MIAQTYQPQYTHAPQMQVMDTGYFKFSNGVQRKIRYRDVTADGRGENIGKRRVVRLAMARLSLSGSLILRFSSTA